MVNMILLENGIIQDDAQLGSVDVQKVRIIESIQQAKDNNQPFILHLHGGLVNRDDGLAKAEDLGGRYLEAGGIPLFFIWKTGFLETIEANYKAILTRALGKWLVKWAVQKLKSKIPQALGGQENAGGWEFEAEQLSTLEYDQEEINQDIQNILSDAEFVDITEKVLRDAELHLGRLPSGGLEGFRPQTNDTVLEIDNNVPDAFTLNPNLFSLRDGEEGFLDPFKNNLAAALAKVVWEIIQRYKNGTNHRFGATVIEELARHIYVADAGAIIWDEMKGGAKEAFNGEDRAGSFLLDCLAEVENPPRVVLVAHSAGSVFVSQLLKNAQAGSKFDVVFLAPAVTYSLFDEVLAEARDKICNFRMFSMRDSLEQDDALIDSVPLAYPSSMLYLISGSLENQVDAPIVGMERFYSESYDGNGADQDLLGRVRTFLSERDDRVVWSKSDNGPGRRSNAIDHGHFDDLCSNNEGGPDDCPGGVGATMESVLHIIKEGFPGAPVFS